MARVFNVLMLTAEEDSKDPLLPPVVVASLFVLSAVALDSSSCDMNGFWATISALAAEERELPLLIFRVIIFGESSLSHLTASSDSSSSAFA